MSFKGKSTFAIIFYVMAQIFTIIAIGIITKGMNLRTLVFVTIVFLLLWMLSLILIAIAIDAYVRDIEKLNHIQLVEKQTENFLRMTRIIEVENSKIRKLYHDLANHITIIENLEHEGLMDERNKYVENLKNNYEPIYIKRYCDDIVMNTIMNYFSNIFEDENRSFKINWNVPEHFNYKNYLIDFSETLNNAYMNKDLRNIVLNVDYTDKLYLEIRNDSEVLI